VKHLSTTALHPVSPHPSDPNRPSFPVGIVPSPQPTGLTCHPHHNAQMLDLLIYSPYFGVGMDLDLDEITRGLRDVTILFSDGRSVLSYFEEKGRIGLRYSEELGRRTVNAVLYCYTDVDECYWEKWRSTHPVPLLLFWVASEKAKYVRGKIMEIRHMRGVDAVRAYIGLALFIFKHRDYR